MSVLLAASAWNEGRGQFFRPGMASLTAGIVSIGAGIYAFWIARDMLGHKERERRLVEARLQAERSSREKSVFLANMSHEIRTPMNAILGFCELLAGELTQPRQQRYLQAMRSSADSLLQLMNDILDMSKIEAGVLELRPEPTDPREICDFLQTVFSEPSLKKGIRFECHIADKLPQALLLDRVRLRQVLINLVGNAVKFTDRGKVAVHIRGWNLANPTSISLLIEVIDTGDGIPEHRLKAIFEPFVQAGTHREKEISGTGLGLAIVKRLTEKMGGNVAVTSIIGQGSTFSLEFAEVPVSTAKTTSDLKGYGSAPDFDRFEPATILVVDDNQVNLQLVEGIFAGTDHRLVLASDGKQALEQARARKPDLILLDLRMPVMGGKEALPALRQIPGLETIPILAVTASSLLTEENQLKRQFSGYVQKPFSRQGLYEALSKVLPARTTASSPNRFIKKQQSNSEPVTVPRELLLKLQELESQVWPNIRDTGAFGESKRFADALMELGQEWKCPPLESYARELSKHAESYALVELEQCLASFKSVVDELRTLPQI